MPIQNWFINRILKYRTAQDIPLFPTKLPILPIARSKEYAIMTVSLENKLTINQCTSADTRHIWEDGLLVFPTTAGKTYRLYFQERN